MVVEVPLSSFWKTEDSSAYNAPPKVAVGDGGQALALRIQHSSYGEIPGLAGLYLPLLEVSAWTHRRCWHEWDCCPHASACIPAAADTKRQFLYHLLAPRRFGITLACLMQFYWSDHTDMTKRLQPVGGLDGCLPRVLAAGGSRFLLNDLTCSYRRTGS